MNTLKNKNPIFLVIGLLLISICSCERISDTILTEQPTTSIQISMIYPGKCLGDMAYCDQLQKGIIAAENSLGIDIIEAESSSETWDPLLREAAQRSDLVITAGYQLAEPIQRVAPEFPDTNFVLIDTFIDLPNVTSVVYRENEGSFLVGAIAALKTETGKVGYIGAVDVPLLRKFEAGYVAGIHAINTDIEIVREYIAEDGSGFSNTAEAKRLAAQQYENRVDIIYTVASGAGRGAVEAAKERQKHVIWVDDNINATAPEVFLTSMVKRVDNSVYDIAIEFAAGRLTPGTVSLGLKETDVGHALDEHDEAHHNRPSTLTGSFVDYALDAHNRPHLSDEIITKVEALRSQIISGEIVVPSEVTLPRE